eukprot:7406923-Pyramimonas_sp.AAC.1
MGAGRRQRERQGSSSPTSLQPRNSSSKPSLPRRGPRASHHRRRGGAVRSRGLQDTAGTSGR